MKKIMLLAVMLVSICSSCFAEWFYCDSPWEFDSDSIRNTQPNHFVLEVRLRSHTPDVNGNRIMTTATFEPKSPNPYHFKFTNPCLVDANGNIVRAEKKRGMEDFNLAVAIGRFAGLNQ